MVNSVGQREHYQPLSEQRATEHVNNVNKRLLGAIEPLVDNDLEGLYNTLSRSNLTDALATNKAFANELSELNGSVQFESVTIKSDDSNKALAQYFDIRSEA